MCLSCPADLTVTQKAKEVRIERGRDSLVTTWADALAGTGYWGTGLSAFFGADKCYLAVHRETCQPYVLVCLDRKNGKAQWQAKVKGNGDEYTQYLDLSHHCVSLAGNSKQVVLFGAGTGCIYIEAFDAETGKNTFRFAR
jgi:hypothetical protein